MRIGVPSAFQDSAPPVPISGCPLQFHSHFVPTGCYAGPRQPRHWHNHKRRHIILPEAGPGSIEHEAYSNQQRPDPCAFLPSLPSASARRIGVPVYAARHGRSLPTGRSRRRVRGTISRRQMTSLHLSLGVAQMRKLRNTLGISLSRVEYHVSEILSTLEVEAREEAADWWRRENGLAYRRRRMSAGLTGSGVARWVVAAGVVGAVGCCRPRARYGIRPYVNRRGL